MSPINHVLIIPGLGNDTKLITWVTKNWEIKGIVPHIFDARWRVEEPQLQPKLNRAIILIDQLVAMGKRVSLIGNSAGGSFAINLYKERLDKIHKVIINCGRVRTGDWPWLTFTQASATSQSFKQAVIQSEKILIDLSEKDKRKILTLRPIFDEIVPPNTVTINGSINKVVPSIEHSLSIAFNLTIYRNRIFNHIKSNPYG